MEWYAAESTAEEKPKELEYNKQPRTLYIRGAILKEYQ